VKTIFYVWTTSRNFPRKQLIKYKNLKSKYEKAKVATEGYPICFSCYNKLKEKNDH